MVIPEGCDETLLKHLCSKEQEALDDLSSDLKAAAEQLKKRKLVLLSLKPRVCFKLRRR
jgi:hypothetical protein